MITEKEKYFKITIWNQNVSRMVKLASGKLYPSYLYLLVKKRVQFWSESFTLDVHVRCYG